MRIVIGWDFFGVINEVEPAQLSRILQQLLDAGVEHIIASHSSQSEIEHYLEANQLKQYFASIYGAEWHMAEPGMGKAPALTDYITNHGPFDLKLMIGDSMNDMVDARTAGMTAVLFDASQHYTNVENDIDHKINNLAEITELIQPHATELDEV